MKIGVFDSGSGGLSVANAIKKTLPEHEIIFVNDSVNVPYGTKTPRQLLQLTLPIFRDLQNKTDVIVVACNTVTTNIIEDLRTEISVPLIGMEPMIKPAAQLTKTKVIAVCATPATLSSARYAWLKETYAKDMQVIEPDCSDWSYMIETNTLDRQKIHDRIHEVINVKADVIVLGCTHYHWIEEIIKEEAGSQVAVLQPELPVITQLTKVLATLKSQLPL